MEKEYKLVLPHNIKNALIQFDSITFHGNVYLAPWIIKINRSEEEKEELLKVHPYLFDYFQEIKSINLDEEIAFLIKELENTPLSHDQILVITTRDRKRFFTYSDHIGLPFESSDVIVEITNTGMKGINSLQNVVRTMIEKTGVTASMSFLDKDSNTEITEKFYFYDRVWDKNKTSPSGSISKWLTKSESEELLSNKKIRIISLNSNLQLIPGISDD